MKGLKNTARQQGGTEISKDNQGHTRTEIISPWIPTSDTAKALKWPQALWQQKCTCTFFCACSCHWLGCGSSAVPVLREVCGEGAWTQCFNCPSPPLGRAASGGSCFGELTCGKKATATALCFYHSLQWTSSLTRVGFRFNAQSCSWAQELFRAQQQLQGLWNHPLLLLKCVSHSMWKHLKLRMLLCNTRVPPIVTVIMWLKLVLITLIFGAAVLAWTFRAKNSETSVSW